jgi:hypothetical protein
VHGNLNEATHRNLAELVCVANVETFRRSFSSRNASESPIAKGRNVYLTRTTCSGTGLFRPCFAHGSENEVFNPVSSRRSASARLEEFQQERAKHIFRIGAPIIDFRTAHVEAGGVLRGNSGYGHMDFLLASTRRGDVYPKIGDFFFQRRDKRNQVRKANLFLESNDPDPFEPPAGRSPDRSSDGRIREGWGVILRVWIEAPDDVTVGPSTSISTP